MKNDSIELTLGDVRAWLEDQKEVHGRKMRQKVRRRDASGAAMALGRVDAVERSIEGVRAGAQMLDNFRRSEAARSERIRARNRKVAASRKAKREAARLKVVNG